MGFIRAKEIPPNSGNWYDYEVENHREGDRVIQKVIRYIGRAGGGGGSLGTTYKGVPSPAHGMTTSLAIVTHVEPKLSNPLLGTTEAPTSSHPQIKIAAPTPVIPLGTTPKQESPKAFTIGDTVYAVDHGRIREGKVVNESWIGEGANAIDWGNGADPGHSAYRTREGAETEIKGENLKFERLKSEQQEVKKRSLNLIEQVEKVSPRSKWPSKMRDALQKYGKLTPAQTETLNNIVSKQPFSKPDSPRIIHRDGEAIEQYYINPVVGWVDKSEVHEYVDDT